MESGHPDIPIPFENVVHILKRKQFPLHYDPYPWKYGKPDDKNACLKSIMAQYIYRYKIDSWAMQDVDFINHPWTCTKTIHHSFRDGNIPGIDLRRFVEALKDPSTGLTKQERKKVEKESRMYLIVKRCGLKVLWNFFTSMVTMLRKG